MIKTDLPAKTAVAQIVREYRLLQGEDQRLAPLRAFAGALSEALRSFDGGVSYQTIKNWGDRRYLPNPFTMLQISQGAHRDWRGDFAEDILAVLHPETYRPASEIGRRALLEHRSESFNGNH